MRPAFILFCLLPFSIVGCNNGPARVAAPRLDAEEITDLALKEFDKNSDAVIDEEELKEAPSLRYSMKALDKNENGDLERAELLERFETYVRRKIGLRQQDVLVRRKGRPVANATIELVPAPFMEGMIESAKGETGPTGHAMLKTVNQPIPAVRVGFYRAKVTSDNETFDAKFNTNTTLGFEIPPVTDGLGTESVIDLK